MGGDSVTSKREGGKKKHSSAICHCTTWASFVGNSSTFTTKVMVTVTRVQWIHPKHPNAKYRVLLPLSSSSGPQQNLMLFGAPRRWGQSKIKKSKTHKPWQVWTISISTGSIPPQKHSILDSGLEFCDKWCLSGSFSLLFQLGNWQHKYLCQF